MVSCKARARARRRRWPLPWPGHGDGEVATARRFWAVWHGKRSSSARKGGRWEAQARRVEASRQEVARGSSSPRGRAALCTAAVSKQVGRQGKGKTGCFAISEISRDLNVKQG